MTYYFSAFVPAHEGGYVVIFPDFPEAATQGETIAECMENAADALGEAVQAYTKARKALPVPCPLEQARTKVGAELTDLLEGEPINGECLWQLILAPEVDMTPVKISISLVKSALEQIDAKAKRFGLTRSGFLARAAKAYGEQG